MFFIIPWKKSIDKICTTYIHIVYDFSNWRLPQKKKKRQIDQQLLPFCPPLCSWLMFCARLYFQYTSL